MNPNINYIIGKSAITFVIRTSDGAYVRRTLPTNSGQYTIILDVLASEEYATMTPEEFIEKITPEEVSYSLNGLVESEGFYYYNGKLLPPALSTKITSIKESGVPFEPLEAFLGRLINNPSATSINELYDFLAYKELPITTDGYFMAYKGIASDGYSVRGNTKTVVSKGVTDRAGRIKNDIFGEEIMLERNQVNDDRNIGCSFGLHVGSFDYAKKWGPRVILVKVDPANVVSVPSDCNFQKCRVSAYIPMAEMNVSDGDVLNPTVDENLEVIPSPDELRVQERIAYIDKVDKWLYSQEEINSGDTLKLNEIIGAIGGTKLQLKDALNYIGYAWDEVEEEVYLW
jgi:hypothetical protein